MKKCILLVFTLISVLSYGQQNSSTTDEGVVINGVKWATRNVDKPGTFASSSESAGKFYQWNRKKAWDRFELQLSEWDDTKTSGAFWEKANDPSPAGWRVPTEEEFRKLLDTNKVTNERVTQNGVEGRKFTDKTTGKSIFLPAVLTIRFYGTLGNDPSYWSSTAYDNNEAYYLKYDYVSFGDRAYGFCVRCVADEQRQQNSSTTDKGVVINGVKWATRNVDRPRTFAAKPEDPGMFYQWNRSVGWSATDPNMKNSNGGTQWFSTWVGNGANSWETSFNPCPKGWRMPTKDEIQSLVNSGSVWTTVNDIRGRLFGSGYNTLFLPAAGMRDYRDGMLDTDSFGGYWSSTLCSKDRNGMAYFLDFGHSGALVNDYYVAGGYSCRCVAE